MSFSTRFPILDSCTYLNTANAGLLSKPLQEWRSKHDDEYLNGGSHLRMNHVGLMAELRQNLATLFGSNIENTYLTPNFSLGFNILLDGLRKDLRFLLLSDDYPSVNYPVTSLGFDSVKVPVGHDMEAHILAAIEKYKPDVFAFSIVQYISGLKIDPHFIKRIKEKYPELLLIGDGTQFCGTAVFNFNASGLDAIISSGYKWMLGGYGNGFVLLSEQLKGQLYQDRKNSNFPHTPLLAGKEYLSIIFEPGHLDTLNFGSLNQSVLYLQSLGLEYIERLNQDLCQRARLAFYERGLLSQAMIERKSQSTLMNLPLDSRTVTNMTGDNILFSDRGAGIRISFHFYNTVEDLDNLLRVLDKKD